MAKNSTPATSTPIDVTGTEAMALAAAYDGIYHLFGGRVSGWDITPDGLIARDFTVSGQYNPETILTDISRKNRRAPLWPTLLWINDVDYVPAQFDSNLAVTTFMVQFFGGSDGQAGSKTADYVKTAAAAYKDATGTRSKRGPKPKTINLKNVRDFNADSLRASGISQEDLEYLASIAGTALATASDNQEPVTVES